MLSGRFIPKRLSKAEIKETDGYLSYEYDVNAIWKEGPEAPGSGIIGLISGHIGGVMECGVNVKVDGKDGKVTVEARGEATKDKAATASASNLNATEFERNRFKPRGLSAADKRRLTLSAQVTGSANTIRSEVFDAHLFPLETMVRQRFFFGALTEARYNLKPYAKHVPYVGPVIRVHRQDRQRLRENRRGRARRHRAGVALDLDDQADQAARRGSVVGGAYPHPELGHVLGGSQERPATVP
ncbi:MAG: hypothetical protein R3F11_05955 [Verrucomicrobiales bacterium]